MAESSKSTVTPKQKKHLRKIAHLGGIARLKKYGSVAIDEEKRKQMWKMWWEREGKYKSQSILVGRAIHEPKYSTNLAEFVGIMIGDGGVSNYFITVTLHAETDRRYSSFVSRLMEQLFKVKPRVYRKKNSNAVDVVIHRKKLVEFCCSIGLKKGNKLKQNLDIPLWVKENPEYARSCLRGLVDTDGTFFIHKYFSKGRRYGYRKISFSSYSPALIKSFHAPLKSFCIKSEIAYNGLAVRIESQENVKKYLEVIGTHNPKHREKFIFTEGCAEW